MSANSIGKKGRNDRRPNNAGGRPGRPSYLHWGDRNNRNNSPSSPEPSLKPPRGSRMRGIDKTALHEGVYGNARMMHSATSIVGCVVQVQVKNGRVYEGILKTFSPKMDIVLDKAHVVDETNGGGIPSRDRIIETLLFNPTDVITITATSVELEYANKDSFTDTAISKFNGQISEKELQPWDPDSPGDGSLESLETDGVPASANVPVGTSPTGPRPGQVGHGHIMHSRSGQNGWDANDMFKTNAEQFNVKSSYDPSLSQYTTQLKADNTKEFRDREARAAKLANEIERSESYKQRMDLENGDEEDLFSAVHRDSQPPSSSASNNNSGAMNPKLDLAHVVVQDRYVPPHQRKKNLGPRVSVNRAKSPVTPNPPTAIPTSQPLPPPQVTPKDIEPKVNGDKEDKKDSMAAGDKGPENSNQEIKQDSKDPPVGKNDSRLLTKRRDLEKELRDFSSNFKLTDNENKEEKKAGSHSTSPQPQQTPPAQPQQSPSPHQQQSQTPPQQQQPQQTTPQSSQQQQAAPLPQRQLSSSSSQQQQQQQSSPQQTQQPPTHQQPQAPSPAASPKVPSKTPSPAPSGKSVDEKKDASDEKKAELDRLSETVKKSTLNPNAKEFVLNPMAKPFTPKQHPVQVSTPPRPQTQSPNMSLLPHNMQIYPSMYVPVSMTQPTMQQQTQPHIQQRPNPKRAVVSVGRPDFNPAAQAAAATGQPLLAQTMPQAQGYMQYVTPSGTAMPQMVPMPGPRMVGPTAMSQQGHPGQDPQVQQQQAQPFIVSPPGAPAVPHIQHHPGAGPTPPHQTTHMGPHQGPPQPTNQHTQQASHIVSQQSGGAHPAQSPVQHQNPGHPGHHQQQPHPAAAAAAAAHQHPGHHPHQQQQNPHHPPPPPHHPAAAIAAAAAASNQHQHHHGGVGTPQQQQQQQQQPPPPHPGQPPHPGGPHQANTTPTPQQPHIIYQQTTQMSQPPHPSLQPSPHTPTSPQSMQQLTFAAPPFSYTSQQAVSGGQQFSYAHNHPHTTVTHAHHQQHTHAPQIIMMQHQAAAAAAGQMTPTGGPPTHLQHGPPQPPIMQAAGPMQGGPHMVPQPTMSVSSHPQIHYMSHHPQMNTQHPPQIPAAYQHSQ